LSSVIGRGPQNLVTSIGYDVHRASSKATTRFLTKLSKQHQSRHPCLNIFLRSCPRDSTRSRVCPRLVRSVATCTGWGPVGRARSLWGSRYAYMYTSTSTYIHVCIHLSLHIYTCVYHTSSRVPRTYIYSYMYTSTYAYIHVCISHI